jgi:hypothetical protein
VKPADDRVGVAVTDGALRTSKSLRRRVKRHPRVTVKVVTTDTGGNRSTLRKRVRVR